MDKKIIFAIALSFVAGAGLGYLLNSKDVPDVTQNRHHSIGSSTDATMVEITEALKGKKGETLEVAFLEGMIAHHEGAIAMATELKLGTKRPELIEMADDIISLQTSEVSTMKDWLNKWWGR